jgi:hypothetical protein
MLTGVTRAGPGAAVATHNYVRCDVAKDAVRKVPCLDDFSARGTIVEISDAHHAVNVLAGNKLDGEIPRFQANVAPYVI